MGVEGYEEILCDIQCLDIDRISHMTNQLVCKGYLLTYYWMKNVNDKEEPTSTLEDLQKIGQYGMKAIIESNLIIVLLLRGRSIHIELDIKMV